MIEPNIQQHKQFKILLIGDECIDEYQYGTVDRISPEAPVPVFKLGRHEVRPGMAGNVKENLKALGLTVDAVLGSAGVKTRLIDSRSRQHIVRIDQDQPVSPVDLSAIDFDQYHAVVVSDYDKGAVTYQAVENIVKVYKGPIFVDTKKHDLSRFNGCIVKINELEYNARTSINDNLIVTLGDRGAVWRRHSDEQFFRARSVEIADVCGAGDTFLAALVYEYLQSNNIPQAIRFAISAAAVTVTHIGVHAPKIEEIRCHS